MRLADLESELPPCPTCGVDIVGLNVNSKIGYVHATFGCGTVQKLRKDLSGNWKHDTYEESTTCLQNRIKQLETMISPSKLAIAKK